MTSFNTVLSDCLKGCMLYVVPFSEALEQFRLDGLLTHKVSVGIKPGHPVRVHRLTAELQLLHHISMTAAS